MSECLTLLDRHIRHLWWMRLVTFFVWLVPCIVGGVAFGMAVGALCGLVLLILWIVVGLFYVNVVMERRERDVCPR